VIASAPLRHLFAAAAVACAAGAFAFALALAPVQDAPLRLALVCALLLLVALGALTWRHRALAKRLLNAGAEREQRFAALLAIAADAYWELDAQYRLTLVSRRNARGVFIGEPVTQPRTPWELPQLVFDDDTLDELRADLEARRRFRERPLRLIARGGVRHLVVSGEPRFDARGAFAGYWGVTHDVSSDVKSSEALRASETRQHELFMRIPSALVVHRGGRVIDANPAAIALFGYPTIDAMRGADILECYEPGDVRERARQRLALANRLPPGHGLPQAEARLVAVDGRRLVVRATGVRIEVDGGPAVLSIYLDDTERRAAEDALRRSEGMLSHLVATSPDLITLTDVAEGRYAMVNDTFTRLTGYTQAEVIGRTSAEIGIWSRPEDRERLVATMRGQDRVKDLPVEFVGKWGQPLSLLVSAARFIMHGRDYLVINARDVTAAEHARLEREAILENASIGIALTRDRRFLMANPAFDQMFGWPAGTLVGQPGRVVWASDNDYEQLAHQIGRTLARGEQVEVERLMARRDGSTFLCRLLARAVDPTHPSRGGTIWIAEDVTERRRIEQALAKARDDAEAASRAKSAFLANTSHEIRTPLNGLVGLVRLARQPGIDEARRRQYLDQIFDSAETLSTIISDILDLSKIEAGKLHVEAVPFSLPVLLDTLHRGYKNIADARALALDLKIDPDVPVTVLGDPVRVRQIVSNYLANALKFTLRGGVCLAARRGPGNRVRFEVKDSGPGIDPATRARLFHPFTQGDESTTRRFGGTGLGLSICRQLAVLMDGEVGVDSEPGAGSCFWAELPLPKTDAHAANSALGPLDGSPLTGAKVLMVEDNPVNMMIAVAMLEQWGAQVTQASNGEQAVEAVRRAEHAGRRFDVVLMDVQMPVMSGHEATRILRREHDRQALPIIALTAAALVSEREAALAAGMNDFLTKPIDAQRLHDTLARVLAPA
jgi:PAS domain S-box-containing protein